MRKVGTYLLCMLIGCFLMQLVPGLNHAKAQNLYSVTTPSFQGNIGVVWNPDSNEDAAQQYNFFRNTGIRTYLIPVSKAARLLPLLNDGDNFFIQTEDKYLLDSEIAGNIDELINSYRDLINRYAQQPGFSGLSILSDSRLQYEVARNTVLPPLENLAYSNDVILLHKQGDTMYRLENGSRSYAEIPYELNHSFRYEHILKLHNYLCTRDEEDVTLTSSELFVSGEWLMNAANAYAPLQPSILYLQQQLLWVFPEPEMNAGTDFNLEVLLLLALWLSVGLHYLFIPTYRAYAPRYYFSHSFFTEDILQYRERSSASSLIVMVQHAIIGGLIAVILLKSFISPTGMDALFHHVPLLGILGQNQFSIFVLVSAMVLLIQIIAILWIYFSGDALSHISQAMNLYAGIFHIDFILVTIMVVLFVTGTAPLLQLILAAIWFLFWFVAFYITSMDASQNLMQGRHTYLFYTNGLHTVAAAGTLILILMFTPVYEIFSLILSL